MKAAVRSRLVVAIAAIAFPLACSDGTAPEPEAAPADATTELDADEVARLRALGYAELAPALPPDANVGVVIHDRERTSAGLNLFTNVKFCSTQLIDMDGNVLHTWSNEPCHRWHNAVMLDSGDLLAVVPSRFLLRLDWQSNVVWKRRLPVHPRRRARATRPHHGDDPQDRRDPRGGRRGRCSRSPDRDAQRAGSDPEESVAVERDALGAGPVHATGRQGPDLRGRAARSTCSTATPWSGSACRS